jgi:hypothetical protein
MTTPAERQRMERAARSMGQTIGKACPPGVGFALIMFTFGEGDWSTYISNANRADMIRGLEEFLQVVKAHRDERPIG